jgi:hypothetical protein
MCICPANAKFTEYRTDPRTGTGTAPVPAPCSLLLTVKFNSKLLSEKDTGRPTNINSFQPFDSSKEQEQEQDQFQFQFQDQ